MSLCFAMNMLDGVLICGDGRVTINGSTNGTKTQKIINDYKKVHQLTKNSVIFLGGMIQPCEFLRFLITADVNDKSSNEDVINSVSNSCKKVHEVCKHLITEEVQATIGGILGCYDNGPKFVGFSQVDGFKPLIIGGNKWAVFGVGDEIAREYYQAISTNSSNVIDNILKTYRHVSQYEPGVGGILTAYFIDHNGAKIVYEGVI